MAAAVHMLSVKLTLIARPLAVVCAPRFASAACTRGTLRRVGLDAYATPRRATLCRCFCRATDGPDLVSLEIGNGDDETFEREDFRKFQKINYERSPEKNPLAEAAIQDYLKLTDKELFAQCKMDCYRASGPGGQHRNKTDSAVRLKHLPTGLVTQACEDRSQHNNRAYALARLRQLIAAEVRGTVELEGYKPPPEVVRILPFEKGVKKDRSGQKIGANHPDFPQGVKGVLDLLEAVGGSVADAAAALGLSTGALSKLITSDKTLWQGANKIRASKGLKPLR